MGEIATRLGLKAQYQVSRLLKLKELRADVRQRLLLGLRQQVLNLAQTYTDPARLHQLDQQLDSALDDQIAAVMQQAEAEASVAHHRPPASLLARRLCHHLQGQGVTP